MIEDQVSRQKVLEQPWAKEVLEQFKDGSSPAQVLHA